MVAIFRKNDSGQTIIKIIEFDINEDLKNFFKAKGSTHTRDTIVEFFDGTVKQYNDKNT